MLVLIGTKRSCGPTKLDQGQLSRWSVYLLIIYSGDKSTFQFRFLVVQSLADGILGWVVVTRRSQGSPLKWVNKKMAAI